MDDGFRPGLPNHVAQKMKALERENLELWQANEILRKASAYFATSRSWLLQSRPSESVQRHANGLAGGARYQLLSISTQISNQIRGLMKTFGLFVPKGTGRVFDGNVRELLDDNNGLARIILPLLDAWRDIRKRVADLDRQLLAAARDSRATKPLTTIPGVGTVTAVSYVAAIGSASPKHR